jgi:fucose permease
VLYASISTLYRQARGLSLAEYAIIDGFSYLFQLAFEIPFGMLADRIGYKKTLIFSNGLSLISKIIFWQAWIVLD